MKKLIVRARECPRGSLFAAVVLILAIVFGDCWLVFAPKKSFSEDENRMLEDPPNLTLDTLKDGSFMKSAESYVGDHFMFREPFVFLNTSWQYLTGRRDFASNYSAEPAEGGVYFGRQGHVYEVLLPDTAGTFRRNAAALDWFAEKAGIPLTILPVPSGSQEQGENLPDFAPNHDQREELETLQKGAGRNTAVVDAFDALSLQKTGRDYYFKTDHHWTSRGAYMGYQALVEAMGLTPAPQTDFEYRRVSQPFYGTLYSKALYAAQQPDTMELPYRKDQAAVIQQTGSATHQGLYWEEYLKEKDKYSVYLGGNPAVTVIRCPSSKGGKLLLLKDSFANSMIPYLTKNFSEIHMIDLRYYNLDIYQYIKQNGITKAAAAYSIKQLCNVSIANKLVR